MCRFFRYFSQFYFNCGEFIQLNFSVLEFKSYSIFTLEFSILWWKFGLLFDSSMELDLFCSILRWNSIFLFGSSRSSIFLFDSSRSSILRRNSIYSSDSARSSFRSFDNPRLNINRSENLLEPEFEKRFRWSKYWILHQNFRKSILFLAYVTSELYWSCL